jgi:chemotaxis family two-component system response regulator Rcp1
MTITPPEFTFQVLLVDDNEDDVFLTTEAFQEANVNAEIIVHRDGVDALAFLHDKTHKKPHLILLDLNMPRKDGRETLAELKSDPDLKNIPVVILTTSDSESDIEQAYNLHANSFITKPINFDEFVISVKNLKAFWFKTVKLPPVK